MSNYLLLACALLSLIAAPSFAEEPQTTISRRVQEFADAYRTADLDTLDDMIAGQYSHINNGGAPIGRKAWLDWNRMRADKFASGAWKPVSYSITDVAITLPAGHNDVAIVTGRARSKEIHDGEIVRSDLRFTNLWMAENGVWKRAAFHDSPARD